MEGDYSPDTPPAVDFWTPPETVAAEVFALWGEVRTAKCDASRDLTHTPSDWSYQYVPSVSTQRENQIANLDPYGIVICDNIHRTDINFDATPRNEACMAVLVKDEVAADFVGDIREIRDRYWSQQMFVDLVQQKLILPTPLRYLTDIMKRQWRPERSLNLGWRAGWRGLVFSSAAAGPKAEYHLTLW